MQKRADSVNAYGRTHMLTDKPTKDKLKLAADAAGMPLTEYLRVVADRETENLQTGFGIRSKINDAEVEKQVSNLVDRAYLSLIEKIERGIKYLADHEPDDVAFFKIFAYGQENTDPIAEMKRATKAMAALSVVLPQFASGQVHPDKYNEKYQLTLEEIEDIEKIAKDKIAKLKNQAIQQGKLALENNESGEETQPA